MLIDPGAVSAWTTQRFLLHERHEPDVRTVVGRWGPRALADDSTQVLREAGATLVAVTLDETRTYLGGLEEMPRMPVSA